jgi:D-threonate/D-erythronate kinase
MMPSIATPGMNSGPAGLSVQVTATVLADDLTGACDAAAAFLSSGNGARVWLGDRALYQISESIQAFHTSSRDLPATQAAAAVARVVTAWGPDTGRFVFKKVDSAGRGPIAAELMELERILKPQIVVLAPAFPAVGRTVRNGILHISDAASANRSIALAELFSAKQSEIAYIRNPAEIEAALNDKKIFFVCDASSDGDLAALVQMTKNLHNCLYAGSAGLAHALAGKFGVISPAQAYPHAEKLLIFSGTPHPLTRMQIAHLPQGLNTIHVEQLRRAETERKQILDTFHALMPDALLLTGGDTAQLVLRMLSAESIRLNGECAPGIPWGTVHGGLADGRIVITKSGGFGAATTLREIAERLQKTK